jgi:hypothetical protein
VIWAGATLVLRLAGQYILRPGDTGGTLVLFAISFPAMAFLARRLCAGPAGAVALALPTLLLDPFSSAFFPMVFPNMSPQVAGVFGGWMLWCCAGALIGASWRRQGDETSRSARR